RPGNSNGNSNNNNKPSANAGPDRIVTVSTNSVRLAGSGKDTDGRIVSYKWEQLAGPNNATIKNSGSANATVTNLKKGRYYFSLTVKDDNNAVDVDKMLVRVTGS